MESYWPFVFQVVLVINVRTMDFLPIARKKIVKNKWMTI